MEAIRETQNMRQTMVDFSAVSSDNRDNKGSRKKDLKASGNRTNSAYSEMFSHSKRYSS